MNERGGARGLEDQITDRAYKADMTTTECSYVCLWCLNAVMIGPNKAAVPFRNWIPIHDTPLAVEILLSLISAVTVHVANYGNENQKMPSNGRNS